MPRRTRRDYPGAWHHVCNRGIARRTLFEREDDYRFLLARLAREARLEDVEVHAYSVLTTHFHLLVRSPRGHLSGVMQRVADAYARRFNRTRGRDGPLFRGRFANRLLETEEYLLAVLLYIDRNPVEARLVARPVDWPWGSAWHHARPRGPRWLRREVVAAYAAAVPAEGLRPGDYERFSERALPPAVPWLVERRLAVPPPDEGGPVADILGAAAPSVRRWMDWKAELADGTSPGCATVMPSTVVEVVARRRAADPRGRLATGRGPEVEFWEGVEAWVLRTGAGLRLAEIAERMGRSVATVHGRLRACARAMRADGVLRDAATSVLEEALRQDWGGLPQGRRLPPGSFVPRPA